MNVLSENNVFAGRYHLLELLGRGGYGEVWKVADQMAEGAVVALKIFAPGQGMDASGIRLFRREYALTVPLGHPNLLKASHYDIYDQMPYLVLPYCQKGSLGAYLLDEGTLNEASLWQVIEQVSSALAYLHKKDILHQDIKPDNVLIGENGEYLLSDFGISNRLQHTIRKSTGRHHDSMTVAYSPPERFSANPTHTSAGDIFSLGVMLYELATGDVPWMGQGGVALLQGAELPNLGEDYSEKLGEIVKGCLNRDPRKRPSAEEVCQASSMDLQEKRLQIPFSKDFKQDIVIVDVVQRNGFYGFVDKEGKMIVPHKYDFADAFSNDRARVKKGGKWGFINKEGREVIALQYDDAWSFEEGLAPVEKGGKWGYINSEGQEIIPLQYDDARSFSEGLATIEYGGEWGYINSEGEEIIPLQYNWAEPFSESLAEVVKGRECGYINKEGEEVIPLQFDYVSPFTEGLAAVSKNSRYGYINKEGEEVILLKYDFAWPFSNGLAKVKKGGKHFFINPDGNYVKDAP